MSVDGALGTRLNAVTAVTDLVGTRIYAGLLPQDVTYPAVLLSLASSEIFHDWNADAGIVGSDWQVDCWASSRNGARALGAEVITALNRWGGTADSTVVQHVFLINEFTDYDDDTKTHRRILEFTVWYER